MEHYSLRIETLLCQLSSSMNGMRAIIAKNPYKEISTFLRNRVSEKSLKRFELLYSGINGKSIADLINENYNIEQLIFDLKEIIENI